MNEYLEWMKSDEHKELAEAEEKALSEHWANDLLDSPHALISVIETKIARAEIGAERNIVDLLKESSKCTLDGGHDKNGFCFCEAIEIIKRYQRLRGI